MARNIKHRGKNKYKVSKEYIKSLLNEGIVTVDGIERNARKMNAVLKSISKNISTNVNKSTILNNIKSEFNNEISHPTFDNYLNTLEKTLYIRICSLNLRSKTHLRVSPKLELVDPSLVVAALNLKKEDLIKDLNFTGFIFENMCMRDLKIYVDVIDVRLSYYRDKNSFEIDCILETENGNWGTIEITLGTGKIPEAVNNLTEFKNKVDTNKYGEPSYLMVLIESDYSYKREDGIYVVSIGNLKD